MVLVSEILQSLRFATLLFALVNIFNPEYIEDLTLLQCRSGPGVLVVSYEVDL